MSRSSIQATAVPVTWTLMLVALSLLWIRSPVLGPGTAFGLWSAPAAIATTATWWWLRKQSIPQIPRSPSLAALITLAWLITLAIALNGVGARLALDGLIMRRDDLRFAGKMLHWLPMAFGGVLSIAGLAAGLEARYRLVNAPETPATPPDPAK
jgi:hypothetical protein